MSAQFDEEFYSGEDIRTDDTTTSREGNDKLPEFEGNKVARTKAQFTSASNLEVADEVYRLDDVKRFYVEAKVVDVRHKVNEKSGELERLQVMKVVDVQPISWDQPDAWKP